MKWLYLDTGQQKAQAYNAQRRKTNQVNPTIALTVCPEAGSRLWSRKGNPKKPSGQAALRIQRFKSREARDPIICQVKYWRGRNCTERGRSPDIYREVLSSQAEHWSHARNGSPHKYQKGIRKQEAEQLSELTWSWEEFIFPPALEKRSWTTRSIGWTPQKNHVSVMGIN